MDLSIKASTAEISGGYKNEVNIEITGADESDILDNFSIDDIINHFDDDKILDYIGEDRVKQYFDLINNNQ